MLTAVKIKGVLSNGETKTLTCSSLQKWTLVNLQNLSPSVPLSVSQAYSLKDYNQLQLNVTLRGLGPDYKAVEEAVSPPLQLLRVS